MCLFIVLKHLKMHLSSISMHSVMNDYCLLVFLAYTMYILSCLLYYHLADISWCGSYVVWYLDSLFWIICRPLALLVQALELAQLAEELVSCIPFAVITLHCWWCSGGMQSSLSTFLKWRCLSLSWNCMQLHCIEKSFICCDMCFTVWLMLTSNRQWHLCCAACFINNHT